jgi:hypothetical protein
MPLSRTGVVGPEGDVSGEASVGTAVVALVVLVVLGVVGVLVVVGHPSRALGPGVRSTVETLTSRYEDHQNGV